MNYGDAIQIGNLYHFAVAAPDLFGINATLTALRFP